MLFGWRCIRFLYSEGRNGWREAQMPVNIRGCWPHFLNMNSNFLADAFVFGTEYEISTFFISGADRE